tara:strand:+ start:1463 stop:1975 length:513 start_codon:yes stop_codon:yes gene_type:complete
MDISYLKNVYDISLLSDDPGLFYIDKLSDNLYPVETLHSNEYKPIFELCKSYIQNEPSRKLYTRMIENFNNIIDTNTSCFIPFRHFIPRKKGNNINTRTRVIFSNFQIIMDYNMSKVLHIYYPNKHTSFNKYKKNKKKYKKNKCPGCYPIFQPNQLAHIGPYGCLGDDIN